MSRTSIATLPGGASLAALLVSIAWMPWPRPARAERRPPSRWVVLRGVSVGGDGSLRERARSSLAWELRTRTSLEVAHRAPAVSLSDEALFDQPFLWWIGEGPFDPLPSRAVTNLRRFVDLGGFLWVDATSEDDEAFDASLRRLLRRAFPRDPLRPIPSDHTIFHSFYLLSRVQGRLASVTHAEGLWRGGRLAVLYDREDVAGAVARDELGNWLHPVEPGGAAQRERAIRFAVNVLMYATCLDYKDDQVHVPFLLQRLGGP